MIARRKQLGCHLWLLQKNFLEKKKVENYAVLVVKMLKEKLHFINSHLDHFPENLGDVSEEQGEKVHQDLKTIKDRYQARWDKHMIADNCWCIN